MSLQLDARQRAMLGEIGVRVFAPPPGPLPSDGGAPAAPSRQAAAGVQAQPAATDSRALAPRPAEVAAPAARDGLPGIEMMQWDALAQAVTACRACQLCDGRRAAILGAGDLHADWLIVGEPPNEEEDHAGEPFVGDGGKLLDNMLRALGLGRRERVYLANVLKCRPGRSPEAAELAQCEPFLRRQVELLQPKVILAMGRSAIQTLLGTTEPLGKLRGRAHQYHGVPVVVTYHPQYLLRTPADKARAWTDLCLARALVRGA